jgi:hypothetical protein
VCKTILRGDFKMYNQQYPFYTPNFNQMQIPPCMRNSEMMGMNPNMMGMNPNMMEPEEEMPEYKLEMMYPKTYYIIYPEVVRHCDIFDNGCCSMNLPTHEEIERMVDNITFKVEVEVEAAVKPEMREDEMRQLGFGGRGLLRDLARVLLLREFFQRRHRPHRRRRHMGY